MYKMKKTGFNLYFLEYVNTNNFDVDNLSFEAIRSTANATWNTLGKEHRELFKKRAEKIGYDNVDDNLLKIKKKFDEIKEKDKKQEVYAKQRISDYLGKSFETWDSQIFFIGHANYNAKVKKCYYPCEIGLVKFSIEDGIIDTLDFCINSGKLPIGHEYEAKTHSESTHQLPVNCEHGISYEDAKKKLEKFLGLENEFFMFTLNGEKNQDIEAATYTFKKIINHDVFVIPLEILLLRLHLNCKKTNKYTLQSARELLEQHNPWESIDIGCKFHYDIAASKYCSLARAKRWAYHIFKLVLPYQILSPGKHTPEIYDE